MNAVPKKPDAPGAQHHPKTLPAAGTPAPGNGAGEGAPAQAPAPAPAPAPSKPVLATAGPARLRRRHWGLMASFVVLVLLPIVVVVVYLWAVSVEQYSSVSGFTVRKEEGGGASELLGGLAQLTGATASVDGDILYEFILSQALIRSVEDKVGLQAHYAQYWAQDPVFSLWPDATIEDMESYWQRVVRVSYDRGAGLIEMRVLAFSPQKAQEISTEIIRQSQVMINALNESAREDAMRYARTDLEDAVARLKTSREALTNFRTRTQIVDPDADIRGRMGVMNNLQQQLAEALIEYDLLLQTATTGDPRLVQARRRIDVIRARIVDERKSFATETTANAASGEDYPSLLAEYEGLVVDREFAEQTYRAALTAVDLARTKASRRSRYLATYVAPTLAESSEFPQKVTIAGLIGLFLLLSWSVMALVYYSIRDRG